MKKWFFILILILTSCGPTTLQKSGTQGATANTTNLITKISLKSATPSDNPTPLFTVTGNFLIGNKVNLHADSNCSSPIGWATAENTYSVNITTQPLTKDGTYTIYANITSTITGTSGCSNVYSAYQYQTGKSPVEATVITPSGPSFNPIVSVTNVQQGASITLFLNSNCSGISVGAKDQIYAGFSQIQTTLPSTSQDGPYEFWALQNLQGTTTCSGPSNVYSLNTKPGYIQVLNPSPGKATRATVRIGNGDLAGGALVPGSLVKLYKNDPSCSSATFVGEKQADTNDISVDITTYDNLPSDGNYKFYATQAFFPPGSTTIRTSPCSLVYGSYTLNTSPTITLSSTSPGTNPLPVFQISGMVPGAEAQVYLESLTSPFSSGSNCPGTIVGSAVSLGQIVDVKLSTPLPSVSGLYTFYAKQVIPDLTTLNFDSSCSIIPAQYTYVANNVVITSPNPGNLISPTLAITSLATDASNTVTIFPSDNCTGTSVVSTPTGGQFAVSIPIPSSAMPNDGTYFFSAKQSKGTNPNACLGNTAYVLDTKPNNFKNVNPATTSGNIATPTFSVSNIASYATATVELYSDSTCATSTLVGTTPSSFSTSTANITLINSISSEGLKTYYVKQRITGHTTKCSTESISYTYNITPSLISIVGSTSGNNPTPKIKVSGVVNAANAASGSVEIWKGTSTCETKMGSITLPTTGTTVEITSDPLSSTDQGDIKYFAKQIINGVTSKCSTEYATYNFNTYLTSVQILTGSGPQSVASGSSNIPAVQIGGFASSSTVQIFSDSRCSSGNLMGAANIPSNYSSSTVTITSNPLNFEGANYYYARQVIGSYTGPCSTVFATYNLNSKPQAPVLLTTSPGTTLYPTVRASNIIPGALIELFTDNKCSLIVGSQLATTTQVDVSVSSGSPLLVDGTYYFYIRQINNGHQSPCSDSSAPYTLNTTPTGISVLDPAYLSNPEPSSNIINPTIQVSGVVPGADVVLYKDQNCTQVIGHTVAGSSLANIVVQNGAFPTDGKYPIYVRQSYAGHTSFCSGNTDPITAGEYNLITRPTLALSTPSTNNFLKPSVTVNNTVAGAYVTLYSGSSCEVGSELSSPAYLSDGGPDEIKANQGLTVNGTNPIYAKQSIPLSSGVFQESPCSSALNYNLNSAPVITLATASPSSDDTPSFTLSNLFSESDIGTKTVAIYSDINCTDAVSMPTAITNSTMTISVNTITRIGTSTFYAKQEATDPSFTSPCSSPGADYNYDLKPTLEMVTASGSDNTKPTVKISNVVAGSTTTLFFDSSCVNSIQTTVATTTTFNWTLNSQLPSDGLYKFYANQVVGSTTSDCSTVFASYSLVTTNFTMAPNPASGTSLTPTVNVTGIDSGDIITLYADGNCSTVMSAAAPSFGSTLSITSYPLSTYSVNHQWWAKRQIPPSFISPCAGPSSTYNLNIKPSSVTRISTSPGKNLQPIFSVGGLNNNATATLYTTNTCSSTSAAGTSSPTTGSYPTSVNVTMNPPLTADGVVTVWARQLSNGNLSECSTVSASYTLDTKPNSPTFSSSGTSNPNPVINVSGVQSGATVKLYVNDPTCNSAIMGTGVVDNSATSINITSYPLSSDGNYTYYAKQYYPNSTFVSSCSSGSAIYPLNSKPTALKLLNTNPTSFSTPRILVEGVSSGDWVYLFQDSECRSVSGSNIAVGSSVEIQTLPALTTPDNYTYYAKRIQGGGQGLRSGCSLASVTQQYDPTFFSNWRLTNQVVNSTPTTTDEFGSSVSTANNYAVVGSPGADGGKGIVYLYKNDGYSWQPAGTLTVSSLVAGDSFGYAVDLSVASSTGNIANGDVLIVGAPDANGGKGRAFVFTYSNGGWTSGSELVPSGIFIGDNFGASVAINQNMAVIGAPGATGGLGTVRYFRGTSGSYGSQFRVDAPAGFPADGNFGFAVAVLGTNFAVSAPMNSVSKFVQFYTAPAGSPILVNPSINSAVNSDEFGYSLDLSSDMLIVGAPSTIAIGNAYIYNYVISNPGGVWTLTNTLVKNLTSSTGGRFGEGVSINSNSLAVVGQRYDLTLTSGKGRVFIYPGPNYVDNTTLPNVNSSASDNFGAAVSAFGGSIIVGAPKDSSNGASFLYRNDQ